MRYIKAAKCIGELFFPPLCLHCKETTPSSSIWFCKECLALFVFLETSGRCIHCFSYLEEEGNCCEECSSKPSPLQQALAAFAHEGPAAAMVHQLKYEDCPHLAKDAAALMVVQWVRLNFSLPDLIVPVPQSFAHSLKRGYNQSLLIAEEMGKMLQRPVDELLKRSGSMFSQTGLSRTQRKQLPNDIFEWKKRKNISGLKVLLIDDVMTTATTLRHCALLLQQGFPKSVGGFAFCAAT